MLHRKIALMALLCLLASSAFGQVSALRDYVGMIEGTYHPDALAFFDKIKDNLKKRGRGKVADEFDRYIKMGFGTGFIYVAPDGTNYVITNHHVVAQTNTLSIAFEKLDGAKTTYGKLKVVAADEDMDIAILSFPDGAKPFKTGLSFVKTPTDEGADVYAAGFPGWGTEQIWQFSKGIISNARMRLPHEAEAEEGVNPARWGPYIQHTSTIDPGNSGGPLLVQQAGVTTGYAVTGINKGHALNRSNTFFAIPADRALAYITDAVKPKDEATKRRDLDLRLDTFLKSIAKPKAVFGVIADYLSNACIASNAEYAIGETFSRAPRNVQLAIDDVNDIVDAMNYCVAWLIEDTFRGKVTGTIRATLGDITKNTDGSYTVPLKFSGERVIVTTWVNEFGIWKLDKAGDAVSGDKTLVEAQKKQREADAKKKGSERFFMLSLGYTNIFDHWSGQTESESQSFSGSSTERPTTTASAFDASLLAASNKYALARFSLTLAEGFWQFDTGVGLKIPIAVKAFTLAPYGTVGTLFRNYDEEIRPELGVFAQGGLMLTTTVVPGLYFVAGYQANTSLSTFFVHTTPTDTRMLKINIGYAF